MLKHTLTFLALLTSGIIFAQLGIGTTDPKSTLEIQGSLGFKLNTITTATTLDDTYHVVLCNNAPYTVTLPPAAANTGRVYRIKNIDPSGDAITIDGNGAETIDGESTYLLQPYKHSITIVSNGTNWYVIQYYNDGNYIEGAISTINCSGTNNGTLVNGVAASGVSSVLSYTGGNAGTHSGQTAPSTGVIGLTATLSAGTFANGAGTLTYTITGTPTSSGTASFAVNIGGQTCTLTRTVSAGAISTINCSGTNNGTLVNGVAASGVSSVLSYTGGNAGNHSGQTVTSTGVTGLTATLSAGTFANGAGTLTYTITGTPTSSGTASFAVNIGGQTCTLTRTVSAGAISTINCSGTNNGTLVSGIAASSVNSVLSYTGGNGGNHSGQTVTSTGVTGLTATLSAGTFASGAGTLTYTITGTPTSSGTASFAVNIGGQTCTLTLTVAGPSYPAGTVHCNGTPTEVVDVVSTTGKTWMDRNLGATRAATSSTDAQAYGSWYQWGRFSDGHQCINRYTGDGVTTSSTTSTNSSTDTPIDGKFITEDNSPKDWRNPQNDNLWQGVNGINNPCPSGYRLPTETEWNTELTALNITDAATAYSSILKLTLAGNRNSNSNLDGVDTFGSYWSNTVSGTDAIRMRFDNSSADIRTRNRAFGLSVRCIKN
jgi:uncharacterized protein (TIGR02145 family)